MTKADGKIIKIKFNTLLFGDPSGLLPTPIDYTYGNTNFAQASPVVANKSEYGVAINAVDTNINSCWGATFPEPWIYVDIGEGHRTAGLSITQSNGSYQGRAYKIEGSNDSTTWTFISEGETTRSTTSQILPYSPITFRYIKLSFSSYWSSSRVYLYDLKVLNAIPLGNTRAFKIKTKEYLYVGGPLLTREYTPISINFETGSEEKDVIELTMGELNTSRFVNAEENILVEYDQTLGNLRGVGGFVESFIESFIPLGLVQIPNPHAPENLKVTPICILELTKVKYNHIDDTSENINATISVEILLTYVGIVNP